MRFAHFEGVNRDLKYNGRLRICWMFYVCTQTYSPFSQRDAFGVSLRRVNGSRRCFIMPTLQAYYNCIGRARYIQCVKYAGLGPETAGPR